ncbi:MAG: ATP-binding cassette domain-containing protein [Negativicutes bacterium]|nr:ATP-binding cassette domain-containing protein [Negativicutes bacterium]
MIKVQNLCKSYNNINVLTDINLHVQQGEIFGVVGQSGVGKSTLLRCINGLETFDKGKMIVNDTDILTLSEKELRIFRRKIGMIFQNFALLNRKTVLDNVMLPMECWKYPQTKMRKKAEDLLELVGLAGKMKSLPHELSGGQKQRVAIARALTLEPDILLSDEATSALDPAITKSVLELLADVNRQMGITIVIVTHDMSVVKTVCDRMAIITGNRIAVEGSVATVFLEEPPELLELVGRKELAAPPGRSIIKLSVRDSDVNPSFLYGLKIDFSIVSADIEQFHDKSFGHLYLSIAAEELERTMTYCANNRLDCVVFESGVSSRGEANVF